MSEETLDYKTFDLGEVLSGVSFPENDIEIYFDETIGWAIYKAEKALYDAEIRDKGDEARDLAEKLDSLKAEVPRHRYVVTVRGVPESVRKMCNAKSLEKFPPEYSFLGQIQPDTDRDDYYNALLWQESIVKVTSPDGAVAIPNEDQILKLRNSVGRTVVSALTEGINELITGAKSGFEKAAQDTSFLSDASPEG